MKNNLKNQVLGKNYPELGFYPELLGRRSIPAFHDFQAFGKQLKNDRGFDSRLSTTTIH